MKIAIIKELQQAVRSFKLPGFCAVLVLFALVDPLMTRYMDKLLEGIGGDIKVTIPPSSPEMAFSQYLGDLVDMGALVLILVTMGLVAGEKRSGVAGWILTRPVTRTQYITGKLITWSVGIVVGLAVSGAIASLYTWTLLGAVDSAGAATALSGVAAYFLFVFAVTFYGSVAFRSALSAAVLGMVTMLGGSFVQMATKAIGIHKYLPFSLSETGVSIVAGKAASTDILPAIGVTLAAIAVLVVLSFRRFGRLELD